MVKTLHEYRNSSWNINSIWTIRNVTSSHRKMVPDIWRWSFKLKRWGKEKEGHQQWTHQRVEDIFRSNCDVREAYIAFSENSKYIWVENIFQQWPGSDSCFKLTPGLRSYILSSRHRTIDGTFREMSAAIGRYCKETVCCTWASSRCDVIHSSIKYFWPTLFECNLHFECP